MDAIRKVILCILFARCRRKLCWLPRVAPGFFKWNGRPIWKHSRWLYQPGSVELGDGEKQLSQLFAECVLKGRSCIEQIKKKLSRFGWMNGETECCSRFWLATSLEQTTIVYLLLLVKTNVYLSLPCQSRKCVLLGASVQCNNVILSLLDSMLYHRAPENEMRDSLVACLFAV